MRGHTLCWSQWARWYTSARCREAEEKMLHAINMKPDISVAPRRGPVQISIKGEVRRSWKRLSGVIETDDEDVHQILEDAVLFRHRDG
jgi:hypothetical protein